MGGAERQAFHLIRHLREERDANISVLGWYGTEGPLADVLREWGCEIFSFPYKSIGTRLSKASNLLRLAMFIRLKIRPDIILPFVATHSKPICQIWRYTGARYAWWNQQDEGRGLYGSAAEKRALMNAVHITSNSEAGSEFITETYQIPRRKILTYNNGTVLPDISAIKPMWRKSLGIDENTPLVSMVANVTPFKDYETLLKAWRTVIAKWSKNSILTPVLAIAGHLKDTNQVSKLKVMAFDLELGSSVKFLGSIDTTDELMWESDLVVHSSVKEGCPNSVCEAMALGKSLVATDIPGTRQAIDESLWDNCLCQPHNEKELADKILNLLADEEQASRIGELNRQRIRNEFSIDGMCSFFLSLIDESRH